MMYKEFNAEIAKNITATVHISKEDLHAANLSTTQIAKMFLESNPEYKGCTYSADYAKGVWTISFYTTSEVVFKEV